jgi:hypothetical protein
MQNVPNPFIQSTMVRCYVQDAVTQSQLEVYDENGVRVKSFPLFKGMNEVEISAGNLPAGQYTYVLVADGKKTGSGTMTIIK